MGFKMLSGRTEMGMKCPLELFLWPCQG